MAIAERDGMLTQQEIEALLLCFLGTRAERGAGEDEMLSVFRWAENARIQNSALDLALKGLVEIDLADGEVVFRVKRDRQGAA